MSNRRVLIVSATAGFIRGFLMGDIEILQNMGYEVHVAANGSNNTATGTDFTKFFTELNVNFHQIDFSSTSPLSKFTFVSYNQMKKLLHEDEYDLIHVHTPIAAAITRVLAKKKKEHGTKIIYTSHGFYFHKGCSKYKGMVYHAIENFMSRYTNTIITINKEDYDNAKRMKCQDVRYINGMGVDTKKFMNVQVNRDEYRESLGIDKDDVMVLAIGELTERKNHQVVVRALSGLSSNFIFVICGKVMNGQGTYDMLSKLAEEYGVRIKFLGFRMDIPQLCSCADIGVLPSSREGLGLAGIELLSAGVPIVTSNVQGIKDYVVNNINGYMCNPFDINAFRKALERLSNSKERERVSRNCKDSVKNFDIKVSYDQRKSIYMSILKEKT